MHIMLTGHRGYIGSHLLKRLKKNHSIVGFDLKDGWDRDHLNNSQDLLTCELKEQFHFNNTSSWSKWCKR